MSTNARPTATPTERALWTFLFCTLLAPAFAALLIFLASVIAAGIGRGPASLLALDRAGQLAWAGQKALEAYVWCAIPAAIAGAAAAALAYRRPALHWLTGASLAAVTASALAVAAGGMLAQHVTPIAFIAALVGAATTLMLRRLHILD